MAEHKFLHPCDTIQIVSITNKLINSAKGGTNMADEKFNKSQDQTSEEIEETPSEMNEGDLEQVSGGMQGASFNDWPKVQGNLVNGDGVKKNQVGDIPFSKTVKL